MSALFSNFKITFFNRAESMALLQSIPPPFFFQWNFRFLQRSSFLALKKLIFTTHQKGTLKKFTCFKTQERSKEGLGRCTCSDKLQAWRQRRREWSEQGTEAEGQRPRDRGRGRLGGSSSQDRREKGRGSGKRAGADMHTGK